MKKTLFTILGIILLVFNVLAQSNEPAKPRKLNVGITGGPSIDWLTQKNDHYDKGGIILGVRYGVTLDINLTNDENYYVTTGVKIEHTGGKEKYKFFHDNFLGENVLYSKKYSAIFLCIPTGIKLKTPSFNNFVIAGNAGLSHAFALNSKEKIRIQGESGMLNLNKVEYKDNSFFKESLFAGLGLEYIIKDNFRVNLMINYNYTFTNYHNRKALSVFDARERLKANPSAVEFIFGLFF